MNKQRAIKMRIGLAGAMLVMVIGGGDAFAQVTQDSTTWEGSYECDDTPVGAGWASIDGGGANPIATVIPDPCDPCNNLLHFAPVDWYQGFKWSEDPGQWDPNTNGGISIEWRINVTARYHFAHIWPSSPIAGRWMTPFVYPGFPDGKAELRDGDTAALNTVLVFEDPNDPNNGGFHTFRLTCDDTTWTLYRFRNAADPVYSGWITTPVVANRGPQTGYSIRFFNEYDTTVFDLDYIRWTNQGTLLPRDPAFCGDPGTNIDRPTLIRIAT
jgi:hypothetical protein